MNRILSLDVLRGFLIFYVVFIHAVLLIIFQANYDYIDLLPIWLIALMFPLLILAMWGPLFSMMSAATNTTLVYHQLEKGKPLTKTLFQRMISYALIVIVHLINMIFFIHFIPLDGNIYRSLLCGTIETGQLTIPNIFMFLNSGTLLLIGLSGLLINLILFFLWRNNGHKNIKRTAAMFIGLAIVFLIIRPFIYPSTESIILLLVEQNNLIPAILLSWLFRGQFGLIPMAAIPFFGVIFGLLLTTKPTKKHMLNIGFIATIGMLLVSLLFLGIFGIPDLTLTYWPISMVAFNLMLMILVMTLVIVRYDYCSFEKRLKRAKRTVFFRRFSMITLTMFVFESIIAVLWAKLFTFLFVDPFPYNVFADLLFLFSVLATWYVIARFWEKIDFKFSIEWFMIKILSRIRGKTSQKLDVHTVLYHPIPTEKLDN
ncbi:MAG: hypothetical protein R6U21_00220 [Thermoplasmatota archaeon]